VLGMHTLCRTQPKASKETTKQQPQKSSAAAAVAKKRKVILSDDEDEAEARPPCVWLSQYHVFFANSMSPPHVSRLSVHHVLLPLVDHRLRPRAVLLPKTRTMSRYLVCACACVYVTNKCACVYLCVSLEPPHLLPNTLNVDSHTPLQPQVCAPPPPPPAPVVASPPPKKAPPPPKKVATRMFSFSLSFTPGFPCPRRLWTRALVARSLY
jgi:hypothetical protein